MENKTWVEVESVSHEKKIMEARWVFKKKKKADNSIRYKGRVVLKSYEQRYEIHFTEIYVDYCRSKRT